MSLTFTALKLVSSDGVTLDLLDSTKWGLVGGGWLPSPPPLRAGLLGSAGANEDIDDEIVLQVRGTGTGSSDAARATDAQAKFTANILALWTMMDKVARFGRGDPAAPSVTLQVCLAGSTVATPSLPHRVLLLGSPGLDPTQSTFSMAKSGLNATLGAANYGEVSLRFRRRGVFSFLLTGPTTATAASAAGTLVTAGAGLSASSAPSPTYVQIFSGWGPVATPRLPTMYVVVGDTNAFVVNDAQGCGTVTKWTAAADGANSRSGFVLRYTPTDTLPSTSGLITPIGVSSFVRVAVLAVVRNTSTHNFRLKAVLSTGQAFTSGGVAETPEILIDASTANPRVVNLGTAALRGGVTRIAWTAVVDDITGGPVLDIDHFVIVNIGDETAAVLVIDPADVSAMTDVAGGVAISPNPLSYATPTVDASGSGGSLPLTVHGDATILTKVAAPIAVMLAAGGGATGNYWRFTLNTGVVATFAWIFGRYNSNVFPV